MKSTIDGKWCGRQTKHQQITSKRWMVALRFPNLLPIRSAIKVLLPLVFTSIINSVSQDFISQLECPHILNGCSSMSTIQVRFCLWMKFAHFLNDEISSSKTVALQRLISCATNFSMITNLRKISENETEICLLMCVCIEYPLVDINWYTDRTGGIQLKWNVVHTKVSIHRYESINMHI